MMRRRPGRNENLTRAQVRESLRRIDEAYQRDPHFAHLRRNAQSYVPGTGNLRARVAIVGEAPGRSEDEAAEPFVGRSGRLLNRMLGAHGIPRQDVWITNIVRYRPPGNRTPTRMEVQDSLPYLLRELSVALRPMVIATMGRVSSAALLESTAPMSELVGNKYRIDVRGFPMTVIPFYHPAFILYRGGDTDGSYRASFKVLDDYM